MVERSTLLAILLVASFAVLATQSWKGDAGFPMDPFRDFPFHAYRAWFVADHLQHGNFFFDFDYKSNTLFSRSSPILPYYVMAPFVMVGGLWNGISWFVIFCYLIIGIGTYFLGRKINFDKFASTFLGIAVMLSYGLVLESQFSGGLHRVLAYSLLPLILVYYNGKELRDKVILSALLGIGMLIHPIVGIGYILIVSGLSTLEIIIGNESIKSRILKQIPILVAVIFSLLLTSFYTGPINLDVSNGQIISPAWFESGQSILKEGHGLTFLQSLVSRQFGIQEMEKTRGAWVSGYIGISLLLLAAIGIATNRRNKWTLQASFLVAMFLIIGQFSEFLPGVLNGLHFTRIIFLLEFFTAILATFGFEFVISTVRRFWPNSPPGEIVPISKIITTIVLVIIIFVDLSPGLLAFPSSNYNTIPISPLFEKFEGEGRGYVMESYINYGWTPFSNYSFIQSVPEAINQEYGSSEQHIRLNAPYHELLQTLYVFGITNVVSWDSGPSDLTVIQEVNLAYEPNLTVLIKTPSKKLGNDIYFKILSEIWYYPSKIGFLLPGQDVNESEVDFVLVDKKIELNEIEYGELKELFNQTRSGIEFSNVRDSQFRFNVTGHKPGFVFISQMWYPNFQYGGKPVLESGGGFTAVRAVDTKPITLTWVPQWYDHVFALVSIFSLVILCLAWVKSEKIEQWLKLQK